jgi:hypothetical protein
MRFRVVHRLLFGLAACLALAGGKVRADEREDARTHLRSGVSLYREQNYAAALVEFEASYGKYPSASALQNMALCQTKLFRYVEAIELLEELQHRFGSTLPAQEVEKVQEALRDLSRFVGILTVRVTPADAKVRIGNRLLSEQELSKPIRLASGEYHLEVMATAHIPAKTSVKMAGGETKTITFGLERAIGHVTIRLNDDKAAIAMDRMPLAYGQWKGQVDAGEHLIQVYKPGHAPTATEFTVQTGDRIVLQLSVGPQEEEDPALDYDMAGLPYRWGKKGKSPLDPERGWYGLVSASSIIVLRSPDGFQSENDTDGFGGAFGLRGGYRLGDYLALEAMVDTGSQSVTGSVDDVRMTYDLLTRRYGANIRLLLGGKSVRLTGALGVGAVWHRLDMNQVSSSGTNSYLGMDLGPQFNVGRLLIDGVVLAYFEGSSSVRGGGERMYTRHTLLPQVGLGLRLGYSQWGAW